MKDWNLTETTSSFRDMCKGNWETVQYFSLSGHNSLCVPHEHCAAVKEVKKEGNYRVSNCEESRREGLGVSNQPYWQLPCSLSSCIYTQRSQARPWKSTPRVPVAHAELLDIRSYRNHHHWHYSASTELCRNSFSKCNSLNVVALLLHSNCPLTTRAHHRALPGKLTRKEQHFMCLF